MSWRSRRCGEQPGPNWTGGLTQILAHSLVHLGAYKAGRLVGYVNVAWDGGVHAFLLDSTVHPADQRRGIGTALVHRAIQVSRARGASWMHVDYQAHLTNFYTACGFQPSAAGILDLRC